MVSCDDRIGEDIIQLLKTRLLLSAGLALTPYRYRRGEDWSIFSTVQVSMIDRSKVPPGECKMGHLGKVN